VNVKYLFWILSVFSFPLGGFAAVNVASTTQGAFASAAAGYIAGFVIGLAQWLAARDRLTIKWPFLTGIGLGVGALVGSIATNAKTDIPSLLIFGLVSGTFLGLAQAFQFQAKSALLWAASTLVLWVTAWAVTANVIVDAERGYVVFGLSGAIIYTAVIGIVLFKITKRDSK
jgi:hypothetical protein